MDFINKVELSGTVSEIRKSDKGTTFVMLKQIIVRDGVERIRLFETVIPAEKTDLINKIEKDKKIKIDGVLTIFKVRKFNIYKMLVEVLDIQEIA